MYLEAQDQRTVLRTRRRPWRVAIVVDTLRRPSWSIYPYPLLNAKKKMLAKPNPGVLPRMDGRDGTATESNFAEARLSHCSVYPKALAGRPSGCIA